MANRIEIGPMHGGIGGPMRLLVDLKGDVVERVETHVGFLHRGVEKLAEDRAYMQSLPYMEKLDYLSPMSYSEAYISMMEEAIGITVNEPAMFSRTVLLEMQRVASHLFWLGNMASGAGQSSTVKSLALKDRNLILRLIEETAGARNFYVNMRLGGLRRNFGPDFAERTMAAMDYLDKRVRFYDSFLCRNPAFGENMKGIGVLSRENAISFGVTGPVMRGSGVNHDARSEGKYYVYDRLNFKPQARSEGDCFSRYKVRIQEMHESLRIVREALRKMPEGDSVGIPISLMVPKAKKDVVRISRETARGEVCMYLVTGPEKPYRLSIRTPSFINLSVLDEVARGCRLADLFTIIGSLDVVIGDVDK